jgi:Arc/MetJ-type ribon-helix-helix transcriptional regulator
MKTISLKLADNLNRKLELAARKRGQTKSAVVRAALEEVLNRKGGGQRPLSALELAGDLVGCAAGPGDLSTNPRYLEGYGQ